MHPCTPCGPSRCCAHARVRGRGKLRSSCTFCHRPQHLRNHRRACLRQRLGAAGRCLRPPCHLPPLPPHSPWGALPNSPSLDRPLYWRACLSLQLRTLTRQLLNNSHPHLRLLLSSLRFPRPRLCWRRLSLLPLYYPRPRLRLQLRPGRKRRTRGHRDTAPPQLLRQQLLLSIVHDLLRRQLAVPWEIGGLSCTASP